MRGLHALGDHARIGVLGRKRLITTLGKTQHAILPDEGGDVSRESNRRFLPRHHHKRRLRLVRETGSRHEGSRGRGNCQRRVLATIQLAPKCIEASRFFNLKR